MKTSVKPVGKNLRLQPNMSQLQIYENKIVIVEDIIKVFDQARLKKECHVKEAVEIIEFLFTHLKLQDTTEQFFEDIMRELKRVSRIFQLVQIKDRCHIEQTCSVNADLKHIYDTICRELYSPSCYDDNTDMELQKKLKLLDKQVKSGICISEKEKIDIVGALNMAQGHWFKCPNGHPYIITECGGAMEVGTCPECHAAIGGTNHSLLSSNKHTDEMDGSSYAAYSQIANNRFNYRERDFL